MEHELGGNLPSSGRTTRRRWPLYLLLLVGIIALAAGLILQSIEDRRTARATTDDQAFRLPATLLGRPASGRQTGANALQTIQSMHGKGFLMANGAVAQYGSATAWVAQATDESGARALTDDMTGKIAGGRSPFTPTGTRQVGGRTVYMLTGMGQSHFYWQAGTTVTWLAIDPAEAEAGLQELVQAIK